MANDLLNLLLCHEEQLKSPHSGGVTLGSISSWQKMRLTIEQSLKKNSSLLPSVTANNFGTFLERRAFLLQTNCSDVEWLMLHYLTFSLILEKSLELKAYCSNGHAMANLFLKDAIYKKRFPPLTLRKEPSDQFRV